AVAAVLCLASAALADDVVLENGNRIEGKARREGAEVVIVTPHGEIRLPAADVRAIYPGKTRWDLYAEKAKETKADDAAAQVALGDWCRDQKLTTEADRHWKWAIEIDPDRRDARQRLG